ncbi:MAG: hypothetical protein JNM93_07690 [Bacteriovoracaceae bacterium]|nr:hypothetical protein [Bacteriovoracaceae bacterium]
MKILSIAALMIFSFKVQAQVNSTIGIDAKLAKQGSGSQIVLDINESLDADADLSASLGLGRFNDLWIGNAGLELKFIALKTREGAKLNIVYSPFCISADALTEKIGVPFASKIGAEFSVPGFRFGYNLKPTMVGQNVKGDDGIGLITTPLSEMTINAELGKKIRAFASAEFGNIKEDENFYAGQDVVRGTTYNGKIGLECKLSDRIFVLTSYESAELNIDQTRVFDGNTSETNVNNKLNQLNIGIRAKIY